MQFIFPCLQWSKTGNYKVVLFDQISDRKISVSRCYSQKAGANTNSFSLYLSLFLPGFTKNDWLGFAVSEHLRKPTKNGAKFKGEQLDSLISYTSLTSGKVFGWPNSRRLFDLDSDRFAACSNSLEWLLPADVNPIYIGKWNYSLSWLSFGIIVISA